MDFNVPSSVQGCLRTIGVNDWRIPKKAFPNKYRRPIVGDEIQTHKGLKRTLSIRTKHSMRIFGVSPFYQATKQHLNNS